MPARRRDVPVEWIDGKRGTGKALGNNAAWVCKCGDLMLGTTAYAGDPCQCGRRFVLVAEDDKKGGRALAIREQ